MLTPDQNTHGTGYGCACVSRDARECIALRYGIYRDEGEHDTLTDRGEQCECLCHYEWDDDEDWLC